MSIRSWKCFPFLRICVHPQLFGGIRVAHPFIFCVLSYYLSLRSAFRVVCWYDSSFISFSRYLCLFTYSGDQHILSCVFFIVILNRPLFVFSSLDLYCIVYSIIYCFCLSLCYLRHILAVDERVTQTRVRCSSAEVSATQILPSSLQYGYEISMSQTTIDLSVL